MIQPHVRLIAAVGMNLEVGYNGRLPWPRMSADMERFRRHTMGGVVIMGSKTWLSLPQGGLDGRVSIVLSRKTQHLGAYKSARSVEEALMMAGFISLPVWVIGGPDIWRQFAPFAQSLFLTNVPNKWPADAFMPQEVLDMFPDRTHLGSCGNEGGITFEEWRK